MSINSDISEAAEDVAELPAKSARGARRALRKARGKLKQVPGPSPNPATNLLIADIGMRGASLLFRRGMEKGLLRARFDADQARKIVEGRTLGATLLSAAVSRVATRSVPGFLLVSGGLLAKTVFDRTVNRHKADREGTKDLLERAENAEEGGGPI